MKKQEREPARCSCQVHVEERKVRAAQFISMNLNLKELGSEILKINKANGWKILKPSEWHKEYKVPAVLALIHSEVSEALEAFRKNDFENFREEMADGLIRILDCASGLGIDMDYEVRKKLIKNKGRGFRHGGKRV